MSSHPLTFNDKLELVCQPLKLSKEEKGWTRADKHIRSGTVNIILYSLLSEAPIKVFLFKIFRQLNFIEILHFSGENSKELIFLFLKYRLPRSSFYPSDASNTSSGKRAQNDNRGSYSTYTFVLELFRIVNALYFGLCARGWRTLLSERAELVVHAIHLNSLCLGIRWCKMC